MSKGSNQKLKLIFLIKYLLEHTDENHLVTMPEILAYLEANDITAERKSIYDDLDSVRALGIDVQGEKRGRGYGYYIGARDFEIAELKLLVDAIQSSKFITERKSAELIKKLGNLVSVHEAKQLKRQVYVSGRVKALNENIFYNIDALHSAIEENKKITFQYFQWNMKKEMELRRNGSLYKVSPWALVWEDENYYLVAFEELKEEIRHYRVDKMLGIRLEDCLREGKKHFEKFNIAEYTKKNFGMFAGEEETVKMKIHKSIVGVIIDRFGSDIMIIPIDEDYVRVNVKVAVSSQFFGWIFGLGTKIKILGPEEVVEKMREQVESLKKLYE